MNISNLNVVKEAQKWKGDIPVIKFLSNKLQYIKKAIYRFSYAPSVTYKPACENRRPGINWIDIKAILSYMV